MATSFPMCGVRGRLTRISGFLRSRSKYRPKVRQCTEPTRQRKNGMKTLLRKCWLVAGGAAGFSVERASGAAWTNLTTLSISANTYYTLAVRSDGTVWGWGTNRFGELGASTGTLPSSSFPRRIDGFSNAVAVAAGARHGLALLADGRVFGWG